MKELALLKNLRKLYPPHTHLMNASQVFFLHHISLFRYLDRNQISHVEGLHNMERLEELYLSNQKQIETLTFDESSLQQLGVSCNLLTFLSFANFPLFLF